MIMICLSDFLKRQPKKMYTSVKYNLLQYNVIDKSFDLLLWFFMVMNNLHL
jgi:hypothetical protein